MIDWITFSTTGIVLSGLLFWKFGLSQLLSDNVIHEKSVIICQVWSNNQQKEEVVGDYKGTKQIFVFQEMFLLLKAVGATAGTWYSAEGICLPARPDPSAEGGLPPPFHQGVSLKTWGCGSQGVCFDHS